MRRIRRIGLTGGIGAGKTVVARRLAQLGAVVVDADQIAREVVEPGTPGLAAVAETFGPDVLRADGSLDRAALGARVFADPDQRQLLNAIVHPLVAERAEELTRAAPSDGVVVYDVPLLVETMGEGDARTYDLIVVVEAPLQDRIERLVRERGMSEAEVRSRIAAQADDATRRAAADVVLVNDGTLADLRDHVDRLWRTRLAR